MRSGQGKRYEAERVSHDINNEKTWSHRRVMCQNNTKNSTCQQLGQQWQPAAGASSWCLAGNTKEGMQAGVTKGG